MKIVTEAQVRRHVSIGPVIEAVEAAFAAFNRGDSAVFPIVVGGGSDPRHAMVVKSGRDGASGLIGVKTASYNPANRERGLSSHTSTTLLIDDATAQPVAVVQANFLNGMRTAAADAVAVKHLARADAETLSVIGAGGQAAFEIEAVLHARPSLKRVLIASRNPASAQALAKRLSDRHGRPVSAVGVEDAVREADVLVTATSATAALFEAGWLRPGVHISAMGADTVGKMELPVAVTASARLYVDHPDQAATVGETQHAVAAGRLDRETLRARTLGALLNGRIKGRQDEAEVTVFDSSGIAVQDIAAARTALALVEAAGAL